MHYRYSCIAMKLQLVNVAIAIAMYANCKSACMLKNMAIPLQGTMDNLITILRTYSYMRVAIYAHGFSHMITMFDFVYTYGNGRTTTNIPQQALNTYGVIIQPGHVFKLYSQPFLHHCIVAINTRITIHHNTSCLASSQHTKAPGLLQQIHAYH